jgi:ribosomal protein S18 acetylase RimI-like enzyme
VTLAVRRAEIADAEPAWTLVDEYNRSFGIVVVDDPASFREYLSGRGGFWIAHDGDELVGCVALRPLDELGPRAGEVKRLYVRPAYRRAGAALLLMDALEAYARFNGYDALYLDTKDDLHAAIVFYERRGYERIARYNDNPQATIFMRRALDAR